MCIIRLFVIVPRVDHYIQNNRTSNFERSHFHFHTIHTCRIHLHQFDLKLFSIFIQLTSTSIYHKLFLRICYGFYPILHLACVFFCLSSMSKIQFHGGRNCTERSQTDSVCERERKREKWQQSNKTGKWWKWNSNLIRYFVGDVEPSSSILYGWPTFIFASFFSLSLALMRNASLPTQYTTTMPIHYSRPNLRCIQQRKRVERFSIFLKSKKFKWPLTW